MALAGSSLKSTGKASTRRRCKKKIVIFCHMTRHDYLKKNDVHHYLKKNDVIIIIIFQYLDQLEIVKDWKLYGSLDKGLLLLDVSSL